MNDAIINWGTVAVILTLLLFAWIEDDRTIRQRPRWQRLIRVYVIRRMTRLICPHD